MRREHGPMTASGALGLLCLVGVSALALSACSSGSSGNGAADTTGDRAAASTINLRAADLPGWQQSPADQSGNDPTSKRLAACAGAPNPDRTHVVDVPSPNFSQGATEVSSDVTTVRTHADGVADLRALTGSKIQGCMEQLFVPLLKSQLPEGAEVTDFSFSPVGVPGSPPDSFGMRLRMAISVPGQGSVNLTADLDGVLVGRAEIELSTFQSDGAVPDQTVEARLLSTLVRRAHATSL